MNSSIVCEEIEKCFAKGGKFTTVSRVLQAAQGCQGRLSFPPWTAVHPPSSCRSIFPGNGTSPKITDLASTFTYASQVLRRMTATEQIYRQWLMADEEEKAVFETQLAAICVAACRARRVNPPVQKCQENGRVFWVGGYRELPRWVDGWLFGELEREIPLKDYARFIGRRCGNALIDEIRCYQRQRRGAEPRMRKRKESPAELARLRSGARQVLDEAGLPDLIRLERDKRLLDRLIAAYPARLSNVSIAREAGVSEGAIRKRRKRIGALCVLLPNLNYQLTSVLKTLGLIKVRKNPLKRIVVF